MAVNLTFQQVCTATETLGNNTAGQSAANRVVTWNAFNRSESCTSATTPPVTKVAGGSVALSGGVKTLDLTSLTGLGANGAAEDFTGLKVQAFFMENPSTNANTISVTTGSTNGYNLSGSDGKLTLAVGQSVLLFLNDAAPDVAAASADTLDFAGTGVQPFDIVMVAG